MSSGVGKTIFRQAIGQDERKKFIRFSTFMWNWYGVFMNVCDNFDGNYVLNGNHTTNILLFYFYLFQKNALILDRFFCMCVSICHLTLATRT